MADKMPLMEAPIPGMGLTSEMGSRPWQRPPEFATLDQVVPYYMSAFTNDAFMDSFLDAIDLGMPITSLVDIMIKASVMEGKHTIDVGMLVAPIMVEALLTLAERSGLDYVSGLEEGDKPLTPAAIKSVMKKTFSSPAITEEQKEAREDVQEAVGNVGKGLLSRRGDK